MINGEGGITHHSDEEKLISPRLDAYELNIFKAIRFLVSLNRKDSFFVQRVVKVGKVNSSFLTLLSWSFENKIRTIAGALRASLDTASRESRCNRDS